MVLDIWMMFKFQFTTVNDLLREEVKVRQCTLRMNFAIKNCRIENLPEKFALKGHITCFLDIFHFVLYFQPKYRVKNIYEIPKASEAVCKPLA